MEPSWDNPGMSLFMLAYIYICVYLKDFYYMTVRIYVIQKFDKNSSDILVS